MLKLFQYNWQVRSDWFDWCENVPEEELMKKRTGGIGGILFTLYHIIEVEYNWICDMQGKIPQKPSFEECSNLRSLREFSARCHKEITPFLYAWDSTKEDLILNDHDEEGNTEQFRFGEALRHVIAHEIHHIGQLSVWSREIGRKPVTANLIRRGLFDSME